MAVGGEVKLGFQAHYPELETKLFARGADAAELERRMAPIEAAVRDRLGSYILAEDDNTLESVVLDALKATGGTLAIYGVAGNRCGAGMRGGGIFVRGDVGDEAGVGALGGMIVIGGDAGERLGDAMNNVTVFIRGSDKSLAEGVTEAPLRKREQLRLGLLLINASIRGDATEFRRVIPQAMLRAEQSQRGELVPNWR